MINSVMMVGRLVRDPELKKTTAGISVATFSLAINDKLEKDKVMFFTVSCFGKTAEACVKNLRKGSLVGVTGRLSQRKYTRKSDNVEITLTEIIASVVDFIDVKPRDQEPLFDAPVVKKEGSMNLDQIDVKDDDLPF